MSEAVVLLVRHAKAGERVGWAPSDDIIRPLTTEGRRQAADLVDVLNAFSPRDVSASPYRRCLETVVPIAAHLGLSVKSDDRLAEGAATQALSVIRDHFMTGAGCIVLCSHGDVIPEVLQHLQRADGLSLGSEFRVQKASTWILTGLVGSGTVQTASYVGPPKP